MTEPQIPSYRFKKMILALDPLEREQTLIKLAKWVDEPTNRYGNDPALSGFLRIIAPAAKHFDDVKVRGDLGASMMEFNTSSSLLRIMVDNGLDVRQMRIMSA